MLNKYCVSLLLSLVAGECELDKREYTNLWKIHNKNNNKKPSYFFATFHVDSALIWPHISQEAKDAFTQSDKPYLEVIPGSVGQVIVETRLDTIIYVMFVM